MLMLLPQEFQLLQERTTTASPPPNIHSSITHPSEKAPTIPVQPMLPLPQQLETSKTSSMAKRGCPLAEEPKTTTKYKQKKGAKELLHSSLKKIHDTLNITVRGSYEMEFHTPKKDVSFSPELQSTISFNSHAC